MRRGDTLAKLFKRAWLYFPRCLQRNASLGELAKTLVTLLPGDELSFKANGEGGFGELKYKLSSTETLFVRPNANESGTTLTADIEKRDVDIRYNFAQGEINSSFWNAAVDAKPYQQSNYEPC